MPTDTLSTSAQTGTASAALPVIRDITFRDLTEVLAKGIDDFNAKPSHPLFIGMVYPAGMALAFMLTLNENLLPMAFPIVAGMALLGPGVALGLYELSRRREQGLDVSWSHAFAVPKSPAFPEILKLGALLLCIFLLWVGVAAILYFLTIGSEPYTTFGDFAERLFLTRDGWTMIVVGNAIGFCFAVVSLSVSVVSFPMLLDKHVTAGTAVQTSMAAVRENPVMMSVWGLIVVGSMIIGSLMLLVGLIVVIPVLGHATWHLYRRVVA